MSRVFPKNTVQSVQRALQILELVAQENGLGLTQIAKAVGLHVATTYNLVCTLITAGYLVKLNRVYKAGPALFALAEKTAVCDILVELVHPHLSSITAQTGEAASCSILMGTAVKIIDHVPARYPVTVHYPQRVWETALALATGRVLVAYREEAFWQKIFPLNKDVERRWDQQRWQRELEQIRQQGFAIVIAREQSEKLAVGFPIYTHGGEVVAAIGAAVPLFRATASLSQSLFKVCAAAAYKLSVQMGNKSTIALPSLGRSFWRKLLLNKGCEHSKKG